MDGFFLGHFRFSFPAYRTSKNVSVAPLENDGMPDRVEGPVFWTVGRPGVKRGEFSFRGATVKRWSLALGEVSKMQALAGSQQGMSWNDPKQNHPLWFPLRDSASGEFPTPGTVIPYTTKGLVGFPFNPQVKLLAGDLRTAQDINSLRCLAKSSFAGFDPSSKGNHGSHNHGPQVLTLQHTPPPAMVWRGFEVGCGP